MDNNILAGPVSMRTQFQPSLISSSIASHAASWRYRDPRREGAMTWCWSMQLRHPGNSGAGPNRNDGRVRALVGVFRVRVASDARNGADSVGREPSTSATLQHHDIGSSTRAVAAPRVH